MAKKKILVLEDMTFIREDIKLTLEREDYHVLTASSVDAARAIIQADKLDLAILDIRLESNTSGIEVAKLLNKEQQIPIIYLSAYSDKDIIEQAKATYPYGFLTKPIRERDLIITVEFALNSFNRERREDEHILIRYSGELVKIQVKDILYISAEGSYCKISTANKVFRIPMSLKNFSEEYDTLSLIRVHRSFIVNKYKIGKLKDKSLLIGQKEIPISNVHRADTERHYVESKV